MNSGIPRLARILTLTTLGLVASGTALAYDRDYNPPGPRGGPGTNWENPPGPRGGPGASPNYRGRHWWYNPLGHRGGPRMGWGPRSFHPYRYRGRDWDNNPPGPRGGPGTNWENPPGPAGGPGASPNRRHW